VLARYDIKMTCMTLFSLRDRPLLAGNAPIQQPGSDDIFLLLTTVHHIPEAVTLPRRSSGTFFRALDLRDQHLVTIEILGLPKSDKALEILDQELAALAQCHSPFIVSYKGIYRKLISSWLFKPNAYWVQ